MEYTYLTLEDQLSIVEEELRTTERTFFTTTLNNPEVTQVGLEQKLARLKTKRAELKPKVDAARAAKPSAF